MALAESTEILARCGAKARGGNPCKLEAGWGTPHPGLGPCRKHGGNLPNVVKRYAEQSARQQAIEWGVELDIDPFAGILLSVRMAYGAVMAHKAQIPPGAAPDSPEVITWMAAQKHAAQIAKMAIDAGIAEREIRIMERLAESISQAFEDAVATLDERDLPPAVRQELAERFAAALERREGGVIEGRESGTNGA